MNIALALAGLGGAAVLSALAGLLTVRAYPGTWISELDFRAVPVPARILLLVACVGGWFAVEGRIEVGTVVAIVSGLGKLNDPWGDVVNWARELSVVGVKYRLFADVVNSMNGRG